VFGRAGAAGRGNGAHWRGADGDDAPDAGGVHCRDDRADAAGGDPGVGVRVRAKAGEHGADPGDRWFQRRGVGCLQVGGDGPYPPGQLAWVADNGGDVVAGVDGLREKLGADASGGRDDGEFHVPSL